MNCDRCHKPPNGVLKDTWKSTGEKLSLCTSCRKAIDNGEGFTLKAQPIPHLSKMAKQLRNLDVEAKTVDTSKEESDWKQSIADIKPFPDSWRNK